MAALVAAASCAAALADTKLSLPSGYRQWFHVNTQVIDKESPLFATLGGIHNVYLSPRAVAMLRSGQPYPDGTIFVDDIHEFAIVNGSYVEGERKVLAIMVRNAKKYATTGGWGFQAWSGGDAKKPIVTDAAKECFGCHTQKIGIPRPDDHQYVFSTYVP
jgi:hypothetical protein